LREQANKIDAADSPYKAIISVMMLKEGWDVKNVTTIVGLRAYSAKSNILPEQTLGRGLRKMYASDVTEYVSVVGTDAFMDFVESIQAEGVDLEHKAMGEGTEPKTPLVIEVDWENPKKDMDALDIEIPVLTPRVYREYKNLSDLDVETMSFQPVEYRQFSEEEQREIVFKDITTGEIAHTTTMDGAGLADYRSAMGYFARTIMKELRLVSGYDVLYSKVKAFVQNKLFGRTVELESANTLRNLSELAATKTTIETFKRAVNDLTVQDKGGAEIRDTIKLRQTRPFVAKEQDYLLPKKSVFNRIIGDRHFELLFAQFLEDCTDVLSHGKNYLAVRFKLDYVNADGDLSNYFPDFLVKLPGGRIVIVETKGQEDLDVPLKMARLRQWCEDINQVQADVKYDFVYVDEESFERYKTTLFRQLLEGFREYKEESHGDC
ncbi:MAG TPA: type III restriction endonuclease subunit R, partial [bacterium]|nr:type III restriction endonuclease subunit R [bacterium]